ncbi:MAG: nickel-responsive regulator 1 [archaeon]
MDEKTLQELDILQKEMGFSGRSETIRQCIRWSANEQKQSRKLSGEVDGIILAVHPDEQTETVTQTRHAFQQVIKTHIHNHLENHTCLELFVIKGSAETVKRFASALQKSPKVNLVKLVVV